MFESLKAWIESIDAESRLFRNADDEVLHSALANLLYHFIALEQRHGEREKHEFERQMRQEFALTDTQIEHLYTAARSSKGDIHEDLQVIASHLKGKPAARMLFMQKLLQLINIHGTHSAELDLFYDTLHTIFPELKEIPEPKDV